ncbi:MAG: GAF domain-containing protein [Caldimonas sp.]
MPNLAEERKVERARQAALDALRVADLADTAYDDLTRAAADIFRTPIALITLVDGDRQWFKSRIGVEASGSAREIAFCSQAIKAPSEVMVVEDASLDARFAQNPFVTGDAHIRFYTGAPLVTSSGHPIGTLCVLDQKPRTVTSQQLEELRFLAQQVITTMERRKAEADGTAPAADPG